MPADLPPTTPPPAPPAMTAPIPPGAPPGGWAVGAGHGASWWSDGWRLFTAAPWVWIGITVVLVALLFVLGAIPVLGHLASTLLYPILGAGVLVGARDLDHGAPLRFGHLGACFDRRVGPLIIATLLYVAGWFVVWLIAFGICVAIFGFGTLSALMSTEPSLSTLDTIMTFGMAALLALLIVLVLGTPLVMAYWFAPALIALRGDAPVQALKSSFSASLRNIPPLFIYSLLGIVFAIGASIPFGLGWIVLAPVFAGSVYASYRDIFQNPEVRGPAATA
jgi:uncharacterized membrane protein